MATQWILSYRAQCFHNQIFRRRAWTIFMPTETIEIESLANQEYKWGFVSDIEADEAPMGLNEDIIRFISKKKEEPQWMLDSRLKAFKYWLTLEEPHEWPHLKYPKIDYQSTIYYSAPKAKKALSKEERDETLATFEKLGVPMHERAALLGEAPSVAVDAVTARCPHFPRIAAMPRSTSG